MKDKDFSDHEEHIRHLISRAAASNEPLFVEFQLRIAQIDAIVLLARVIQERPHPGGNI